MIYAVAHLSHPYTGWLGRRAEVRKLRTRSNGLELAVAGWDFVLMASLLALWVCDSGAFLVPDVARLIRFKHIPHAYLSPSG